MKKGQSFYFFISLLLIALGSYVVYDKLTRRKEDLVKLIESELNLIINNFTNRSTLVVLESKYTNTIKVKVHRSFFSDFYLDYIVVGSFSYGIDLRDFGNNDLMVTKDSVIITVPKPELFNNTIDHTQSRFVNATWRFGINEFEVADSAYVTAQNRIYEYASSRAIAYKAEIAGEEVIKQLVGSSTKKPVRVNYK